MAAGGSPSAPRTTSEAFHPKTKDGGRQAGRQLMRGSPCPFSPGSSAQCGGRPRGFAAPAGAGLSLSSLPKP